MRIFIDESGSFSWTNKGKSLFCGVSVSDPELPELTNRFLAWKKSIDGGSKGELKGQALTANQLYSFAIKVLQRRHREIHLTLVGADTRHTAESFLQRLRGQAAELFRLTSELYAKEHNQKMAEILRQMSGWVRNRSTSNVFWIIVLQQTIIDTLKHSIVRFADPEHAHEFEDIEIAIDESFIRRDEHVTFWKEFLRNDLMKGTRIGEFFTIREWGADHPFRRKYQIQKGLLNLRDLFNNHTDFYDSRSMVGLQVADICANICYRHFRKDADTRAFDAIRPRIVGQHGAILHTVDVGEASLHKDDLANHVSVFDIEEWKRLAGERDRNANTLRAIESS